MVKLKFVEDSIVKASDGRRQSLEKFVEFIEELYKHPGKWAEYPEPINHSATLYRIKDRFADIEVALRGGNNLATDHPDKKAWTAYIRYAPSTVPVEEELI